MSLKWDPFQLQFLVHYQLQLTQIRLKNWSLSFLGCFGWAKSEQILSCLWGQFFVLGILNNQQGNISIASTHLLKTHMCGLVVKHSCLQSHSCFLFFRNQIRHRNV